MATANHALHRDAVFEPDETHAIAVAFDEICREMNLPEAAVVAREIIAMRIIDLAREGLLDPTILRNRVLREARMTQQLSADNEMTQPSMRP